MKRRGFLAATGTVALAGCSAVPGLGGPAYDDSQSGDDILPEDAPSDAPDDMVNAHDMNDSYARVWHTSDEQIFVLADAKVYAEVEGAEDKMESSRATAGNDEDYPLADDAFISDDDEAASVALRHSNLVLQTAAARQSGMEVVADRDRAARYAELLFEAVKVDE